MPFVDAPQPGSRVIKLEFDPPPSKLNLVEVHEKLQFTEADWDDLVLMSKLRVQGQVRVAGKEAFEKYGPPPGTSKEEAELMTDSITANVTAYVNRALQMSQDYSDDTLVRLVFLSEQGKVPKREPGMVFTWWIMVLQKAIEDNKEEEEEGGGG